MSVRRRLFLRTMAIGLVLIFVWFSDEQQPQWLFWFLLGMWLSTAIDAWDRLDDGEPWGSRR